MGRCVILNLVSSCLLCAAAFSQASAPTEASPAGVAEYQRWVGIVKNVPAHKLDHNLPALAFGDWLQAEVGSHAQITWALHRPSTPNHPEIVEVGVHANDGRVLFINLAVGPAAPHIFAVFVRWDSGYQEAKVRMREVLSMLREIRQESENPY